MGYKTETSNFTYSDTQHASLLLELVLVQGAPSGEAIHVGDGALLAVGVGKGVAQVDGHPGKVDDVRLQEADRGLDLVEDATLLPHPLDHLLLSAMNSQPDL